VELPVEVDPVELLVGAPLDPGVDFPVDVPVVWSLVPDVD